MIIESLKVSNILSYPYLPDFDKSENTINFNDNLNILIGSNGSGKSNLIEIINQLFSRNIYLDFKIDREKQNSGQKIIYREDERSENQLKLIAHKHFKDKESKLQINIKLDDSDLKNLIFICENLTELKEIENNYSSSKQLSNWGNPDNSHLFDKKNFLIKDNVLTLRFNLKIENIPNKLSVFELDNTVKLQGLDEIIYLYFRNFFYIQTLIEVAIKEEKKNWKPLNNTLLLITSDRHYSDIEENFDSGFKELNQRIHQAHKTQKNNSAKRSSQTKPIFDLVVSRVLMDFRDKSNGRKSKEEALKDVNNKGVLKDLNGDLERIGLKIQLSSTGDRSDLIKLDILKYDDKTRFGDLSSGEKNFLYLAMSFYANNFGHGVVLIDEPEIHLHPAMQKKFHEIALETSKKLNLQIIIASHSGIFINDESIDKVTRFFKDKNQTKVISPKKIDSQKKDLVRILNYTNSSRIFFADYVVLVEGDTDEYFFSFFYENYIKKKIKSDKSLEILNIGGKGDYKKWKKFLELFQINTYFIGDFDNITEFSILGSKEFEQVKEKTKKYLISKIYADRVKEKTKDGEKLLEILSDFVENDFEVSNNTKESLTSLWNYLLKKQSLSATHITNFLRKEENKTIYEKVVSGIDVKYLDNIFILKNGDLEDYLNIPRSKKGLKSVIDFCLDSKKLKKWCSTKNAKFNEIFSIFEKILK